MSAHAAYRTLRLLLAVVLIAAVPHKLLDPAGFALAIARYDLLPTAMVNTVALILPWVEVLLAALLVSDVLMGPTLWLTNLLFAGFTAAIGIAMARGLDIDCGCFSAGTTGSMILALVRDLVFLLLGLILALLYTRAIAPSRAPAEVIEEPAAWSAPGNEPSASEQNAS